MSEIQKRTQINIRERDVDFADEKEMLNYKLLIASDIWKAMVKNDSEIYFSASSANLAKRLINPINSRALSGSS